MLTICYKTTVTLHICLSVTKNVHNTTFEVLTQSRPFFKMHALLNNGLDKTLCRICKKILFPILISIILEKESFINAKKY